MRRGLVLLALALLLAASHLAGLHLMDRVSVMEKLLSLSPSGLWAAPLALGFLGLRLLTWFLAPGLALWGLVEVLGSRFRPKPPRMHVFQRQAPSNAREHTKSSSHRG